MQEKLRALLRDGTVTKIIWVIYFATFYVLVFQLLFYSQIVPFSLKDLLEMASHLATVFGVVIAWKGIQTWRKQVKAPARFAILQDFKSFQIDLETSFHDMHNAVDTIDLCTDVHSDSEVKLLDVKLKYEQRISELLISYVKIALLADHTFNGGLIYSDSKSLGFLSTNVQRYLRTYFHSLTSCQSGPKNSRKSLGPKIIKLFSEIGSELTKLEDRI
ncbi:MAG: hypothetical protein KJ856_10700 [Gammaproteobacteria bacterium]|nr:hypothetical protein [Gammaproteobacteria bacterium]MBU1477115.1 hypothetical protein [Gammaproteobacteria bacterium]MBU2003707.1 hypothetical protein [Gammaproteobacteria bacterium]MBU2134091.1 hypothetical protein [Gammaproteobacteria bacterium]MBU2187468.1 hypothetical protein [Gammaproteobacteria bacterium]